MIRTKDLLSVVTQVMSGCRAGDTNGRNMLIQKGYAFTWSQALSVLARLPKGCEDVEGIVSSSDIFNFISKLKKDEVAVASDGKQITISNGSMVSEFAMREDESIRQKFDYMETDRSDLVWHDVPARFYQCLTICTIPGNKSMLNGVCMSGGHMYSTDFIRFHLCDMGGDIIGTENAKGVYISNFSAAELLKCASRFDQYAVSRKWIFFRNLDEDGNEVVVFACNRYDDSQFPVDTIKSCFDTAQSNEDKITGTFPKIEDVLDLAQTFDMRVSMEKSNSTMDVVELKVMKDGMAISSQRTAAGRFSEKVKYDDGATIDIEQPITVKVSVPFLKESLKNTRKFMITKLRATSIILLEGDFFKNIISVC